MLSISLFLPLIWEAVGIACVNIPYLLQCRLRGINWSAWSPVSLNSSASLLTETQKVYYHPRKKADNMQLRMVTRSWKQWVYEPRASSTYLSMFLIWLSLNQFQIAANLMLNQKNYLWFYTSGLQPKKFLCVCKACEISLFSSYTSGTLVVPSKKIFSGGKEMNLLFSLSFCWTIDRQKVIDIKGKSGRKILYSGRSELLQTFL